VGDDGVVSCRFLLPSLFSLRVLGGRGRGRWEIEEEELLNCSVVGFSRS
jgi:hypothetical protein